MTYAALDRESGDLVAMLGAPDAARTADTLRQLAVFEMSHGAYELAERMTRLAIWVDPGSGDN